MRLSYKNVIAQALREFGSMLKDRQDLDLRLAQKEQFIRAGMTQLPDDARKELERELDNFMSGLSGLSDSIRSVLSTSPRKWLTATGVRDALVKAGFDFGSYASNPLASVHSALKRLKPQEAEMTKIEGVMAWRWKNAPISPRRSRRLRNPVMSATGYRAPSALINLMNTWTEYVPPEEEK